MQQEEIIKIVKNYKALSPYRGNILQLGLFGSVAAKTATDESDIDICVELRKPKMFDLIAIKQDLETLLKHPVDIVMLRKHMNPYLKRTILEDGIRV